MTACFPCCGRDHRICDDVRLAYGKLKEIRLMYRLGHGLCTEGVKQVTEFRKAALTK